MSKRNKMRKNAARLGFESLEARTNPTAIGTWNIGATTATFDVTVDSNSAHTIHVFSDNVLGSTGVHILGIDSAGGNPLDVFIPDQTILLLQLNGKQFLGVNVDMDAGGFGAGNDTINAGPVNVTVAGQTYISNGLELSNVGHRLNLADGGAGNDTITGGAQGDSIVGGTGNDSVNGGAGNDTIEGGTGNDTITGGAGRDSMYGGDGLDIVNADAADLFNGSGEANVSGGAPGALPAPPIGGVAQPRYSQSDFLIISGTAATGTYTNETFEVIQGSEGNDSIVSNNTGTNVEVYGNGGNDNISSTSNGNDTLYGGAGNDTVDGGAGNDVIDGDAISTYAVTAANPGPAVAAAVGSGNDSLLGGTGNDTIEGGTGNDTVQGGVGADTMTDAGGTDTLDYSEGTDGVSVILGNTPVGSTGTILANGNAQGDTAPQVGAAFENVNGSQGADFIQGNNTANVLDGLAGDDTVNGADGNDTMEGGAGSDTMYGDGGADTMRGEAGDDFLEGGSGNDRMDGGADNDTLEGQRGNDVMDGGVGADTVDGGLGADTFLLDANATAPGDGAGPFGQLNPLDQYWGGQEFDRFEVYNAWDLATVNGVANTRILNQGRVDGTIEYLRQLALDFQTDYFSGIDILTFQLVNKPTI